VVASVGSHQRLSKVRQSDPSCFRLAVVKKFGDIRLGRIEEKFLFLGEDSEARLVWEARSPPHRRVQVVTVVISNQRMITQWCAAFRHNLEGKQAGVVQGKINAPYGGRASSWQACMGSIISSTQSALRQCR